MGPAQSLLLFSKRLFAVLTAFSAFPFDCAKMGELVTCSKP